MGGEIWMQMKRYDSMRTWLYDSMGISTWVYGSMGISTWVYGSMDI